MIKAFLTGEKLLKKIDPSTQDLIIVEVYKNNTWLYLAPHGGIAKLQDGILGNHIKAFENVPENFEAHKLLADILRRLFGGAKI